jgi:hypothetical protein
MNAALTYQLALARQQELLEQAAHLRLAKDISGSGTPPQGGAPHVTKAASLWRAIGEPRLRGRTREHRSARSVHVP